MYNVAALYLFTSYHPLCACACVQVIPSEGVGGRTRREESHDTSGFLGLEKIESPQQVNMWCTVCTHAMIDFVYLFLCSF